MADQKLTAKFFFQTGNVGAEGLLGNMQLLRRPCKIPFPGQSDKIYFLSYVGAAYIVWLAIHILRSRPGKEISKAKNYGFKSGLIVQLTNVKVILFCITVLSSYVRAYTDSILDLFFVACVLPFIGGPLGNLAWLFAGVSLQGLFQRHWRAVNIVMALSLIVCAVNLVVR